mgnify:CR=1 FL=1
MCVPSVGMSAYCLGALNGLGAPLPAPLPDGGGVVEVAAPLPLPDGGVVVEVAPAPLPAPLLPDDGGVGAEAAGLGCLAVGAVEGPAALGCEVLGVALQRKGNS